MRFESERGRIRRVPRGPGDRDTGGRGQSGSVLMLVLFVCLAVAVVIQGLSTAVLCAECAAVDEAVGRKRLEEKDQGLAALRQRALILWEALPWTLVTGGEGEGGVEAVEGSLSEIEGGAGSGDAANWVMSAAVRQEPTVSRLTTSAWIERGRDGIDLPLAALVASSVAADPEREAPWLEVDSFDGGATDGNAGLSAGALAYVRTPPEKLLLGEGCSLAGLSDSWRLDPGWLALVTPETTTTGTSLLGVRPGVAPSPQVAVLTAPPSRTLTIPADLGQGTVTAPILVVVSGGADLDVRGLNDVYGVIVVDGGSLRIDGGTIHGAVFVTETVNMGESGRLLFSRPILRWATDRSLNRTRLVPGTRWENTE